ncbi:MAG: hypothetical protein ACKOX5_10010, partial [Bacteroidota bacterium]
KPLVLPAPPVQYPELIPIPGTDPLSGDYPIPGTNFNVDLPQALRKIKRAELLLHFRLSSLGLLSIDFTLYLKTKQ